MKSKRVCVKFPDRYTWDSFLEYLMYHCPFPDHKDSNPSFMVHKTRYKCLGCNRNGNYQQFIKEYNN